MEFCTGLQHIVTDLNTFTHWWQVLQDRLILFSFHLSTVLDFVLKPVWVAKLRNLHN